MIYLVDIDGTLADLSHRLHFIQKEPADWDGFFAACAKDEPIHEVIATVCALHEAGAKIVYVTGRSDAIVTKTQRWLAKYGLPVGDIYMRKAGDHRHDDIVKRELLDQIRAVHPFITAVFEDRKQVVD